MAGIAGPRRRKVPRLSRTTLSPGEALAVVLICFGLPIAVSLDAVLSGFDGGAFTDAGAIWLIGTELMLGAAALLFLRARGFDVRSLLPHPSWRGTAVGLGLFVLAWLLGWAASSPFQTEGIEQPVQRILAESRLDMGVAVAMALVNGSFEEVFLLGVLVRGLRGRGLSIAVGAPLLVRVLYHLYQGPGGAAWVMAAGLVFTLAYVRRGDLWPPVFAHVLWDIVPFTDLFG